MRSFEEFLYNFVEGSAIQGQRTNHVDPRSGVSAIDRERGTSLHSAKNNRINEQKVNVFISQADAKHSKIPARDLVIMLATA